MDQISINIKILRRFTKDLFNKDLFNFITFLQKTSEVVDATDGIPENED